MEFLLKGVRERRGDAYVLDWLSRSSFRGRDVLLEFYAPFRQGLINMMQGSLPETDVWNFQAFIQKQPSYVHGILQKLRTSASIVSTNEVSDHVRETLTPELLETLADPGMNVVVVMRSFDSSTTLSLLIFLHAVRRNVDIIDAIQRGRLMVATLNALPDISRSDYDTVFLLEDAVYSGGMMARNLRETLVCLSLGQSRKFTFRLDGKERYIDIDRKLVKVILPMATEEAIRTIDAACVGPSVVSISIGGRINTIFSDLTLQETLMLDVFLVDALEHRRSYMFDVLKLDDRHTMRLLQHKVNDMSMAPHTFLHVGPCFPKDDTVYRVASTGDACAILQILRRSRSGVQYAEHARLASDVKSNWEKIESYMTVVPKEGTAGERDCVDSPILLPGLRASHYNDKLAMFA